MKFVVFTFLFYPFCLIAAPKSFDFKDAKGVNAIIFQLDALLESINGSGSGISGTVTYDSEQPENTKGSITLDAASLRVDNPVLQEHMHGEDWLNVTKFKNIEFSFSNLKIISTQKHSIKAEAEGKNDHPKYYLKDVGSRSAYLLGRDAGKTKQGPRGLIDCSLKIFGQER